MLGRVPVLLAAWYTLPSTYACAVALTLSGVLAAAAGIGGGGIIVAVLMFFGDLQPHEAVPMSKAVVFAGVLVSSFLNAKKTIQCGSGKDSKAQSLVDYDIVATIVPMALAGTLMGVWLNSRVNGMVIVVLLTATLASMVVSTSTKLREQLDQEREDERLALRVRPPRVETAVEDHRRESRDSNDPLLPADEQEEWSPSKRSPRLPRLIPKQAGDAGPRSPTNHGVQQKGATAPGAVPALVGMLAFLLMSVILGGVMHAHMLDCHKVLAAKRLGIPPPPVAASEGVSFIQTESRAWGMVGSCESSLLQTVFNKKHLRFLGGPHGDFIASFPLAASLMSCTVCFLAVTSVGSGLPRTFGGAKAAKTGPSDSLLVQIAKQLPRPDRMTYATMAFVTGILAGLVGIGGGLIFSPFMIAMGVNPHVAVATSTFCVIFTSTSTTMQYLLLGRIFVPLAFFYGICNQVSSYGGTYLIHYIQDNYPSKRSYPTAIVLVAVLISAALTMAKLHSMYNQLEGAHS